jgi:DNA-3-methyladenine glycosylase
MDLHDLLERDVLEVAPALLGRLLLVDGVGGTIVEVEAYRDDDPASHSFGGPRGRNRVMFGPAGNVYVYRSYGIHWCMNVVTGPEGQGAAVLLRSIAPEVGIETMQARRGLRDLRRLCAGPGRLAQALDLTGADDGAELNGGRIRLERGTPVAPAEIRRTRRIGISKAVDKPWRFVIADSPYVSRPRFS